MAEKPTKQPIKNADAKTDAKDAKKLNTEVPKDKKIDTKETKETSKERTEEQKKKVGYAQEKFKQKKSKLEEKKKSETEKKEFLKTDYKYESNSDNPPTLGSEDAGVEEHYFGDEKRDRETSEKEAIQALKEKHDAEIEDTIKSINIDNTEPETQKALHREALITSVDIEKISDTDKKKALEGIRRLDGKEIDITKLTSEQKKIIQQYQTEKYLKELNKLSDADKKDPNKLQEIAKKYLGIIDSSDKQKTALLSEESFREEIKKNPSILSGIIESIKEHGFMVVGINPKTELGQSLLKISQGNVDEYKKLFPQETDIKKLADILSGSYIDILGGAPITGLENFKDSIKNAQDSLKSGELGGIMREDYKTDKEYQDALNKAAKDATGMDYKKMTSTVNKVSRSGKLNPFLKLLADLLAPIGALMGGEVGEFWRNYLRESNNGKDVAGGGFDGGGQGFEKIKNTTPDAFVNSAAKYLGWPYKYGANGSSKETGIDCSQLVVNSLIDEGCLPKGFDTTAMGFAQRSHKLGDNQGKKGDFLIMGNPSPHIAIIAEDPAPGSNTYKTIEAASGKGGVVYTQRTAGNSFKVYRNPFFEGAGIAQNKEGTEKFNIAGTPVTITPPLNPKNLSDRNKNPLNIKSDKFPGDSKGHSICPSYEAGVTIAVEDLQKKLNGQSDAVRRYTGGRNAEYVRDVIGTWAPESDGNNPNEYTRTVLSRMGFSGDLLKIPVSAVKNRIPELVLQMAKMEGCQATFEFGGGH